MPPGDERSRLLEFVEPYLDEWRALEKSEDAAFRDWAAAQVLWDYDLSREQIEDATALDYSRDRGIDGWYYATDDEPPTLHIIQAKNTRAKVDDLLKMINGVESLFDQRSGLANSDAKSRASDLRQTFLDGTVIEFHVVTSHIASAGLRQDIEGITRTLSLFERDIPSRSTLHDLRDLVSELRVVRVDPIDAKFDVPAGRSFQLTTASQYRTATLAVAALDLARLFRDNRTNLFRLNPRYYLSSRGSVNGGMLRTLRDPNERSDFFLYNNGVTAVCESIRVETTESGTRLDARDFQIVNGCQTTATLFEAFDKGQGDAQLENVFVLLRVIEAPKSIAPLIMQRTNTQNPMKAEDDKANDARQIRLKVEFDRLVPPWFYEHKRGVWVSEYPYKKDKTKYLRTEGGYRHIAMKDLAQAGLAFLGNPAGSIEGPRFVFQSAERYDQVFPEKAQAAQLLFPYVLYEAAAAYVTAHGVGVAGSTYLRYPLVAGVARVVKDWLGLPEVRYLPAAASLQLAETLDDWAPDAMSVIFEELAREAAAAPTGIRAAVRQREWFEAPVDRAVQTLRRDLSREATYAKKINADPNTFGQRALFPLPIVD